MSDTRPMTPEQATTLKQLAKAACELDAFKPNLTRAEPTSRSIEPANANSSEGVRTLKLAL